MHLVVQPFPVPLLSTTVQEAEAQGLDLDPVPCLCLWELGGGSKAGLLLRLMTLGGFPL